MAALVWGHTRVVLSQMFNWVGNIFRRAKSASASAGAPGAAQSVEAPRLPTLEERAAAIDALYLVKARRIARATLGKKFAALLGGGGAALAYFMVTPMAHFTTWNFVGLLSAVLAFIAGVFLLQTEDDSAEELQAARAAIGDALKVQVVAERDLRRQREAGNIARKESDRLASFAIALDAMRLAVDEIAMAEFQSDASEIIDSMLTGARHPLQQACGFAISDIFAICVFRHQSGNSGELRLCCQAHLRTTAKKVSDVRKWRAGQGVGSAAFQQKRSVIVSDLLAPELDSLYNLRNDSLESDAQVYRSIVAYPIYIDEDDHNKAGVNDPWGIIAASSNQVGHFTTTDRRHSDVVRAIGGMVALALKVNAAKPERKTAPPPPPAAPATGPRLDCGPGMAI
jgi:hypothetical protein